MYHFFRTQGIGGSDVSASMFHLVSAVSPTVTSYKELRGGWSNVCYVFCFPSHSLDVFYELLETQKYYILDRIIAVNPVNSFLGM